MDHTNSQYFGLIKTKPLCTKSAKVLNKKNEILLSF